MEKCQLRFVVEREEIFNKGLQGDLIESLKQRNVLFIELLIFLKV